MIVRSGEETTMKLNITLPEDYKRFIDAEVAAGGHESPAEYIQSLLMQAVLRRNRDKVDALLLTGLTSGEPKVWTDETVESIRRRVLPQQPADGTAK